MSFPGQSLQRAWHLVDASNQTVGRLAGQISQILKGKHKPTFRPNKDMGDHVIVINAEKVHFSGKKWTDKVYRWHTGYPGGLKERSAKEMMERRPEEVLKKAILGMLKRNNLRHQSIEPRLRIYVGPDHPHTAQLPPDTTTPLPRHPRAKSGDFHFGLRSYNSQTTIGGAGEKK
ncbi:ribosomal protein L13 [Fragilariopsis cylindrus CCMP1102]|uniref:Ribosomal protein L13 n=1 Tax=Fragilariopsis cylindrus CCMP1102 TaxID=635003 RepID=A0A1E7F5Z3_9STRA|nr:ribosomal protein L13 [Fragilariopsis cylindrus CCMP1102]|eukprot:OEU13576.1 ribosomal protein L13 [Fragilariopsis cylindrus CCMP1102]